MMLFDCVHKDIKEWKWDPWWLTVPKDDFSNTLYIIMLYGSLWGHLGLAGQMKKRNITSGSGHALYYCTTISKKHGKNKLDHIHKTDSRVNVSDNAIDPVIITVSRPDLVQEISFRNEAQINKCTNSWIWPESWKSVVTMTLVVMETVYSAEHCFDWWWCQSEAPSNVMNSQNHSPPTLYVCGQEHDILFC